MHFIRRDKNAETEAAAAHVTLNIKEPESMAAERARAEFQEKLAVIITAEKTNKYVPSRNAIHVIHDLAAKAGIREIYTDGCYFIGFGKTEHPNTVIDYFEKRKLPMTNVIMREVLSHWECGYRGQFMWDEVRELSWKINDIEYYTTHFKRLFEYIVRHYDMPGSSSWDVFIRSEMHQRHFIPLRIIAESGKLTAEKQASLDAYLRR